MRVVLLSLLWALCACGSTEGAPPDPSAATGEGCSPALTYEGVARPFMQAYCARCHSKDASLAGPFGAPSDHHFDTRQQISDWAQHIFLLAAGTRARINRTMPLDAPFPSDEERLRLGAWLICGAP